MKKASLESRQVPEHWAEKLYCGHTAEMQTGGFAHQQPGEPVSNSNPREAVSHSLSGHKACVGRWHAAETAHDAVTAHG